MAFEKFTRTRARIGTPKASIWSRGQIGFNQGAMDEYKLHEFKYAILYYDRDTSRIGIEFTNDENVEGACKLVRRKGAGTSMSALAFLKHYKIDFSKTRKYDFNHDKESGLYIIDLIKKI